MAVGGAQEVELLSGGTQSVKASDSAFVQNMLFRNASWEVRKGFGQIAQFDTTFGALEDGESTLDWGYTDHLGSQVIKTSFGHTQIVSVLRAHVRVSDNLGHLTENRKISFAFANRRASFNSIYLVSIYDVTTGARWEEPVCRSAAEAAGAQDLTEFEMPRWHGHYETCETDDYSRFIEATETASVFFVEMNNILYFGNRGMGVCAYIPATFRSHPQGESEVCTVPWSAQLQTTMHKNYVAPRSESPLVMRVTAANGLFQDGISYFNNTEFPKPVAAAVWNGRIVYASEYAVYFTDPGWPGSISGDNWFSVPTDEPITALAVQGGVILIWTENTTWVYRPNNSGDVVVTAGSLVKASSTIGCLGPSAVASAGGFGMTFWMDARGCYQSQGNFSDVKEISQGIKPFFTGFLSNPLHHYFTTSGQLLNPDSGTLLTQPRTTLQLDTSMVNATVSPELGLVMFSVPKISNILCYHYLEGGHWSFWSTESLCVTKADGTDLVTLVGDATDPLKPNIPKPWVTADTSGVYLVGGIETQTITNTTRGNGGEGSVDTDKSFKSNSYFICKYGVGGALDRSVELGEDNRVGAGKWIDTEGNDDGQQYTKDTRLFIGKPIPIPTGTSVGRTSSTPTGAFWLPIGIAVGEIAATDAALGEIKRLGIDFKFDKNRFTPIYRDANRTEVLWVAPAERVRSQAGFGFDSAAVNHITYGLQRGVYARNANATNDMGAAPDGTENRIQIQYHPRLTGSVLPATWNAYPFLNLRRHQYSRLMYLAFKPVDATSVTVGMGLQLISARVSDVDGNADSLEQSVSSPVVTCKAYIWEQTRFGSSAHQDNDVAQPVDWAYKSDNVALDYASRIRARTMFLRLLSRGFATQANRVVPDWDFGILNTLIAADLKEWSSQVVDVADTDNLDHSSVRIADFPRSGGITTRVKNVTGAAAASPSYDAEDTNIVLNVFGETAATESAVTPQYGRLDAGAGGTQYLIGDEQVNDIAISDSVKGGSLSFMFFGHLGNKAERLVIETIKAALRVVGGRRRRGRQDGSSNPGS